MPLYDADPSAPLRHETPAEWAFQRSVLSALTQRRQEIGEGQQKPSIETLGRMIDIHKSQMGVMEQLASSDGPIRGQKSLNLLQFHAWARALGLVPAVAFDTIGDTFFRSILAYTRLLPDGERRTLALRVIRALRMAPLEVARTGVEMLEAAALLGAAAEAARRQG